MYQVFNSGHRLEAYTDEKTAAEMIRISESFNIRGKVIGRVEASTQKKLTIRSEFGQFEYA